MVSKKSYRDGNVSSARAEVDVSSFLDRFEEDATSRMCGACTWIQVCVGEKGGPNSAGLKAAAQDPLR